MKSASNKKIKKKKKINSIGKSTGAKKEPLADEVELEQKLREAEEKYKFLFENILNGYAFHKIVVNRNNKPVDYIFLEVNDAFQRHTGLKRRDIIGRKVTEVIPGIRDSEPDLVSLYGKVALTGKKTTFDMYFEPFDKWYYVNAYSPQKGYFIAIYEEISERKKVEEDLRWELSVNNAVAKLSEALIDPKASLQDAANITLSYAKSLTGSNHGFVSSIDPETKELVGHTLTDMMEHQCKIKKDREIRFATGKGGRYGGLWGHALNTKKAFLTNEPEKHRSSRGVPGGHITLRNYMAVPAVIGDDLVGQIALANSSRDFEERDIHAIKRLATSYAIAVLRKRSEDLLSRKKAEFESIFNSISDAIVFTDKERRIIMINPSFTKVLGYSYNEVSGKTANFIYADQVDYHKRGKKRHDIRASDALPIYEMNYIRKDGTVFVGETLTTEVKDESKTVLGYLSVIRDITDRKLTEKALSWESAINRTFAELGRVLLSGKTVEEISDLTLENAKLLTGSKYGYVGYIDTATGHLICSTMTRDIWNECDVDNKDIVFKNFCGLRGWVLDNSESIIVNDIESDARSTGTPTGHIPIDRFLSVPAVLDGNLVGQIALANKEGEYTQNDLDLVTRLANIYSIAIGRSRYEDSIRESESRFKRLFESASDSIFIIDPETTNFIDVNENAAEKLGYSRAELLQKKMGDIYSPLAEKRNREIIKELKEKGQMVFEHAQLRKDGSEIPVEISSRVIDYGDKKVFQSIVRDISDRKKLEESRIKLRNLESIGTLAGGIAHDFNNIMMAIFGNIQLAKMKTGPDDAIYACLAESEKSALAAKSLARQLLTFSRGGSPVRKLVPISRVLEDCVALIPGGSSISCDMNIDRDIWPVNIDEEQIRQAFENIIKNAVESMPGGGVVTITAENTLIEKNGGMNMGAGRYVLVSITDEGSGISDENLNRIFDPYFTTKRMSNQRGLGLGLSIAYSIIDSHDGVTTVQSKKNVGSTFFIYIPAVEKGKRNKGRKQPVKRVKEKKRISLTEKAKILLMDDDDSVRHIVSDILKEVGYDVETSKDGSEVLRKYKNALNSNRGFDIVILDLTVKYGWGGNETLEELKKIDPDVKAIISSGFPDDPVMVDFRDYGFKGVLVKPYKVSELEETLNSVMSR